MDQKEESWAIKDEKLNGVTNGSNKYKSDQWQQILQQKNYDYWDYYNLQYLICLFPSLFNMVNMK